MSGAPDTHPKVVVPPPSVGSKGPQRPRNSRREKTPPSKGPPSVRPPSRVTIAKSQSPPASVRPKIPASSASSARPLTYSGMKAPGGSLASPSAYGGSVKKPTAYPSANPSQASSTLPQGTHKQPTAHPSKRATAWYPVEQEIIEPHLSPSRLEPIATSHPHDGPPEFLAQQWNSPYAHGWQTNTPSPQPQSGLQPDAVIGTLHITSLDLNHIPSGRRHVLEEKARLDIARVFGHPVQYVTATVGGGSMVVQYKLDLPESGPSAVTLLSRVAAELGKQNLVLPELEKEYRIVTGSDFPAVINYELSDPPRMVTRAKVGESRQVINNGWGHQRGPLEIKAVEGKRRTEVVGPHVSYETSRPWAELDTHAPLLPGHSEPAVDMHLPQLEDAQGLSTTSHSPIRPAMSPPRASGAKLVTMNAWEPVPPYTGASTGPAFPSFDELPPVVSTSPPRPLRTHSASPALSLRLDTRSASYNPQWQPQEPEPIAGSMQPPPAKSVREIREQMKGFLREQEAQYAEAGRHRDVMRQCAVLGTLGAKYHHMGDYESSVLYHTRELEMLKAVEGPEKVSEMAKVCSMLGNAHWAMNNWEKAIKLHERRLEIAEQQGDKRGRGAAYGNLGNVYHAMGDHKTAVKCHAQHQKCVEAGDMETMGAVYHNLGLAHYGAGDVDSSLDCFRHSMEIALGLGDQAQVAKIHGNLAMAYKAKDKLQEAVNELHLQLKTEMKLNDLSNAASTTFNVGNIYVSQGDYTNALHYYERGVDLCSWHKHTTSAPGTRLTAKLFIATGSCKYHLAQYPAALHSLEKALQVAEVLNDTDLIAAAHSNLGLCFGATRDYEQALRHHGRHLELAVSKHDKTAEGAAHGNLGNTYKSMGQFNKAIDHYEKDLGLAMEVGDMLAQGQAFDNLGLSCQAVGEYHLSVEYHLKALGVMREMGYRWGEGEAHCHLGNAYGKVGNAKKSVEHHHCHLDVTKEAKDVEGQGRAYGALGKACFDLGMFDKAVEYLSLRLKLARQLGDHVSEAKASGHLFLAYTAVGNPRKAEEANRHHRALCAKHNLHTIEESEDGVSHIRMEIAEALQDPRTNQHATQRLMNIASRLG